MFIFYNVFLMYYLNSPCVPSNLLFSIAITDHVLVVTAVGKLLTAGERHFFFQS